jgi:hypothetical protein
MLITPLYPKIRPREARFLSDPPDAGSGVQGVDQLIQFVRQRRVHVSLNYQLSTTRGVCFPSPLSYARPTDRTSRETAHARFNVAAQARRGRGAQNGRAASSRRCLKQPGWAREVSMLALP